MKHPPTWFWMVLAGLLAPAVAPARGATLGEGWPYFRVLNFKQAASTAPGDNLAWVLFYSNGAHRADGGDFRVTTPEGVIVPLRMLQVSGNGDLVRIAFVTHGDGPYHVWWGNPKADKSGPLADIRRGVWCEISKFTGGELGSVERIRKAFDRVQISEGSVFVPEIFLGYNPLGNEANTMFRYRAQFHIERLARYDLAFAVEHRGYVALDGVTVLEAPFAMPQDARNHKVLELKPGWHDLEVAQVNLGGQTSVALAWKRPGEGRFETIPRTVFAPVAEATAGPLQKVGQSYAADFDIQPVAEAFAPPEFYLQRYMFAVGEAPAGATLHWEFGDGQTAGNEPRPSHFFLAPGIYEVTLTVSNHGLQFKAARRIHVQDRMYSKFPYPPEDAPKTVTTVLDRYERGALNAEQRLRGLLYCKFHGLTDATMAWGKSWEEAAESQDEARVWEETVDLADLCARQGALGQAAQMYHLAADKPLSMDMKLRCLRMYAIEACDYGANPDEVLQVAEQWKPRINAPNQQQNHNLQILVAYAAIAKGDGTRAAQAIHDAGERGGRSFRDMEIHQGVLARNIETAIRTHEYSTANRLLNEWESDRPAAMLEGFTRLLKVKLLVTQERPLAAAHVAQQLARANPGSFYAAELLYRASEALRTGGKEDEAKTVLNVLKDKYPESPYARGAKLQTE